MIVSTDGKLGDVFETSMEIFDTRGNDHRVQFAFEKEFVNGWKVTASIPDGSGVFLDAEVGNLLFNEDGTFALVGSGGDGDPDITIDFDSVSENQTIDLDFNAMTHMATDYAISQTQNGAPPGTLVTVAVSSTGELSGLASNGKLIPLAQLAIASFANDGGLDGLGGNYFRESLNSGTASIGSALTGGRGQVIGNQLENSNVDIAQEFTQLIVAQRGFSANARTITVADQVLEELTNLIR